MNTPAPVDSVIPYAPEPARISRLAVAAVIAALVGAVTFFLIVPSLVALLLALIASRRIDKDPMRLAGKGFATSAFTISLSAICLSLLVFVLTPSLGGGGHSGRSACAANLRGIMQSMIVYASENNNIYPVVTYAPYSAALNSPAAAATQITAPDALKSYYKAPFPQAGSVTASLWILVLNNQTTPKQFLCPQDPFTGKSPPASIQSGPRFYDNFQMDTQISYSAAYPWKADGTVGKWWIDTTDSTLPILADMAPENGTGAPRRDLISPAASLKERNSGNHNGDGQNVAFADAHAEFTRRPDVGQDSDNIWTTSGKPSTGPAAEGRIPASRTSPALTRDEPPFDIEMLPIRNLDTGRL